MNKTELAEVILATGEVESKAAAGRIVEAALDGIGAVLEKGGDVRLAGFGNFSVQKKAARMARNPRTGEQIKVAKKKVVKFKPASALKERVDY